MSHALLPPGSLIAHPHILQPLTPVISHLIAAAPHPMPASSHATSRPLHTRSASHPQPSPFPPPSTPIPSLLLLHRHPQIRFYRSPTKKWHSHLRPCSPSLQQGSQPPEPAVQSSTQQTLLSSCVSSRGPLQTSSLHLTSHVWWCSTLLGLGLLRLGQVGGASLDRHQQRTCNNFTWGHRLEACVSGSNVESVKRGLA